MAIKITYEIVARIEGNIGEVERARVPTAPTLNEVLDVLASLAMVGETVAHLQGKEDIILPTTTKARAMLRTLRGDV
jgi:hypothetical protein